MHQRLAAAIGLTVGLVASAAGTTGLHALRDDGAVDDATSATSAARAHARVPSSPTADQESVYQELKPCRIVNTKQIGKIPSGATRSYAVTGTGGFAPQGGTAGGCGVPASASSVAVVVTTSSASGAGTITGWGTARPEPDKSQVRYGTATATSSADLPLGGTAKPLTIRVNGGATHVAIDVVGYFAPQIHGQVDVNGVLAQGSERVLSASRIGTGTYTVTVDRNIVGCSVTAAPFGSGGFIAAGYTTGSTVATFYAYRLNGTSVDINFQFTVTC